MAGGTRALEHGSIGEARTKEILIDRFWILERTVDADGADFIIQTRLTDIAGVEPNRLGIVQAKFRENINNVIEIKWEYIIGNDGVRDDFFLLIHTGKEDNKEKYFLTATDIANFELEKGVYKVKDLNSSKYKFTSNKQILDSIEKNLEKVTFYNNRKFAHQYLSGTLGDINNINNKYNLYLAVTEYDETVLDVIKSLKEELSANLKDILHNLSPLVELLKSDDPNDFISELTDEGSIDSLDTKRLINSINNIDTITYEFIKQEKLKVIKLYDEVYSRLGKGKISYINSFIREMEKELSLLIKDCIERQDKTFYSQVIIELKIKNVTVNICTNEEREVKPDKVSALDTNDSKSFSFAFTWSFDYPLTDDLESIKHYSKSIVYNILLPKIIPSLVTHL